MVSSEAEGVEVPEILLMGVAVLVLLVDVAVGAAGEESGAVISPGATIRCPLACKTYRDNEFRQTDRSVV